MQLKILKNMCCYTFEKFTKEIDFGSLIGGTALQPEFLRLPRNVRNSDTEA